MPHIANTRWQIRMGWLSVKQVNFKLSLNSKFIIFWKESQEHPYEGIIACIMANVKKVFGVWEIQASISWLELFAPSQNQRK